MHTNICNKNNPTPMMLSRCYYQQHTVMQVSLVWVQYVFSSVCRISVLGFSSMPSLCWRADLTPSSLTLPAMTIHRGQMGARLEKIWDTAIISGQRCDLVPLWKLQVRVLSALILHYYIYQACFFPFLCPLLHVWNKKQTDELEKKYCI